MNSEDRIQAALRMLHQSRYEAKVPVTSFKDVEPYLEPRASFLDALDACFVRASLPITLVLLLLVLQLPSLPMVYGMEEEILLFSDATLNSVWLAVGEGL